MTILDERFLVPPPCDPSDPAEGLYSFERTAPITAEVGPAKRSAFAALGYLAVADVYDADQIASVLDGLAAVARAPDEHTHLELEAWAQDGPNGADLTKASGEAVLDHARKLFRFVHADERLHRAAHDPAILGIVADLLGSEPKLFQDMALLKPPGGGREKPWHQDKAYFHIGVDEPVVGVWIALDDATCANGCMHVLPGSHLGGPARHVHDRDWQICDSWLEPGLDTAVPLPAGSALFFDGFLRHGTPANRTRTRRRAVQFHYARGDVVETASAEHERIYGSGSSEGVC